MQNQLRRLHFANRKRLFMAGLMLSSGLILSSCASGRQRVSAAINKPVRLESVGVTVKRVKRAKRTGIWWLITNFEPKIKGNKS